MYKRKEIFVGSGMLVICLFLVWSFDQSNWSNYILPAGLFIYLIYVSKLFTNRYYSLKTNQKRFRDHIISQQQALIYINEQVDVKGYVPPLILGRASPDFVSIIIQLILNRKPKKILECGSGASSLIIASLIREKELDTTFITLEHDRKYYEMHLDHVRDHRLEEIIDSRLRPLTKQEIKGEEFLWYEWEELEEKDIDMVIVDGPPGAIQNYARYPVLPMVEKSLKKDAILLLDDAARRDEQEIIKRWISNYPCTQTRYWHTQKGTAEITYHA